ncbi:helix-turn-helix domain-containing protein [Fibrobacter sp.]|uniref:helix-turn-helix domain-containing protein n=1 Tax=Fibrobacter sp. TaxID=35828 RepID=UPI00386A73B6
MKSYRTGNIIKQLRRETRAEQLTIQEQAENIGVSTSTLYRRYKTGTLLLSDFILLCQKLNISPTKIIEKAEKSAKKNGISHR